LVALFVHIVSQKTQFQDKGITRQDIDRMLPSWRKSTDMNPEMRALTDLVLDIWYKNVKLAK